MWDPFGTLENALWIGGAQWSGKSTVGRILAHRHGITVYHYDYHDARGHNDRRIAQRALRGQPLYGREPEPTAELEAQRILEESFADRFEWALDDLRALVSGRPVLAEGWGLRPELVMEFSKPDRMIVMVPSEDFRQHQARTLKRAAIKNIDRDRIIAEDAVQNARKLGVRVYEVDGSRDAEQVAGDVADHFAEQLRQ
ncbi:hypothetical protein Lesp02_37410 [Lentzea sp. NBRC 105346]|uniref:hypothetical protein n=1 Tax=Lentzea sp. NBRC 105346 TaxID=3032205 RepID=UPI0024A0E008|nr:hypothetical protein [Lentzea sp. NBRC 105346]GLZ31553.1 hypothetical protein Lesp02_37410 [Lentzea sp. NBRC 105346]